MSHNNRIEGRELGCVTANDNNYSI